MTPDDTPHLRILEPDETLHVQARASDAVMLVTDRRVAVAVQDRLAMAVPFEALRRIQFDVERDRHATLILVPDQVADTPQVLVIPPEEYSAVGEAIAVIGQRFVETASKSA